MTLKLTIENEARLPDGGPLGVTVAGTGGIDIGRDQHLDWTLPDPSRVISGRHCEIRYRDGSYWLHDVSTNGTFVNGAEHRVQSPYRLRHGDRVEIGHYIIAVAIEGEGSAGAAGAAPAAREPDQQGRTEFWSGAGEVAPPIARRELQPARDLRPVRPDFIDWAVESPVPTFEPPPVARSPAARSPAAPPQTARPADSDDLAWAPYQARRAAPVEPPPPIPTPRRPAATPAAGPDPWDETPAAPPSGDRPASPSPVPVHEIPAASAAPAEAPPVQQSRAAPAGEPNMPAMASAADFRRRFARGAGLPEDVVDWQDSGALAENLGVLMRLVAGEMTQLLLARAESKRVARSTSQTMIQAVGNNPLKFSPTVEDALRLMFGKPTGGYLDARRAFEDSFKDLKTHQVKTYSAMQHALRMLVEDLDPQAVSETVDTDRGLGALVGSRKAKLWDAYVARWEAKTAPHDDGLVDAFMIYFAECYDRGGRGGQ